MISNIILILTSNDDAADLSIIAPAFNETTNYEEGAVVTYNKKLYKCTTPHTAGSWNASNFEETTVVDLTPSNVTVTVDSVPTENSENPISSGAIYTALNNLVIPVNPATEPTTNGSIWITT